jgi:hypothetical protein
LDDLSAVGLNRERLRGAEGGQRDSQWDDCGKRVSHVQILR